MQYRPSSCPVCGTEIPDDRLLDQVVVCNCGWTHNPQKMKEGGLKQGVLPLILMATFIITSFLMVVNWDKHALSIVPLKIKQWTGIAGEDSLHSIAAICHERMKYDCEIEAYKQAFAANPNNPMNLASAAKMEFLSERYQDAYRTYTRYFQEDGTDLNAHHKYAKILGMMGDTTRAEQHFRYVLQAKPKVFQVTVVRDYILMLKNNKMADRAYALIHHYRSNEKYNAAYFMDKEFKELSPYASKGRKLSSL